MLSDTVTSGAVRAAVSRQHTRTSLHVPLALKSESDYRLMQRCGIHSTTVGSGGTEVTYDEADQSCRMMVGAAFSGGSVAAGSKAEVTLLLRPHTASGSNWHELNHVPRSSRGSSTTTSIPSTPWWRWQYLWHHPHPSPTVRANSFRLYCTSCRPLSPIRL